LHKIVHLFGDKDGWSKNRVFATNVSYHAGFEDAYRNYGIDQHEWGVVIGTPDLRPLKDSDNMGRYIQSVLQAPGDGGIWLPK